MGMIALLFIGCLVVVGQCKPSSLSYCIYPCSQSFLFQNYCFPMYVRYLSIIHWRPYNIACVAGHPEPKSTLEDGHANMTMLVSSLAESKLTLKLCVDRDCKNSKREPWTSTCVCCLTVEGIPCFHSRGECQKHCPSSPPIQANKGVHY